MNLTLPPNKIFRKDLEYFHYKLSNGENFTLSKYADGEWAVLQNRHIDNGEFHFDPNNKNDQIKRHKLLESFQYKNPRYYVGISCPCCQGIDTFNNMYSLSNQDNNNITWANIWVNSNYKYYVDNIIPLFNTKPVLLFCNEKGDINSLPFRPHMLFPVKDNAWEYNWKHIDIAKQVMTQNNIKDSIVLFCCGPFGNILAYELTMSHPENTYLDIGSTLNPYLKSEKFKRDYYIENTFFANMTCIWGI